MFWNLIFQAGFTETNMSIILGVAPFLALFTVINVQTSKQAGKLLNSAGATDGSDLRFLHISLGSTTSVHLSLLPSSRLLSPASLPWRESQHWGALAANGSLKFFNCYFQWGFIIHAKYINFNTNITTSIKMKININNNNNTSTKCWVSHLH